MNVIKTCAILLFIVMFTGIGAAVDETGVIDYRTSHGFALSTAYDPSEMSTISATVTPTYTENDPYDVNTTGLMAWYRFDELSGINVSDDSGNMANGTINVSNDANWVSGKYNGAIAFNGSGIDQVTCGRGFNQSGSFTVIAWCKTTNAHTASLGGAIVNKKSTATNAAAGYMVHVYNGKPFFRIGDGTNYSEFSSLYNVNDGNWHQVAYIVNRTSQTHYSKIDNRTASTVKDISNISSDISTSTMFQIGGSFHAFNGSIDNVMLYNRSLSDAELMRLYYDNVEDVRLKTDVNDTYSDYADSTESVGIPFSNNDSNITSMISNAPNAAVINGVNVSDYITTITPFGVLVNMTYYLPSVVISASTETGTHPLNVSFACTCDHAVSWVLEFGDGESSNNLDSYHMYDQAGVYTATLTATNLDGATAASHKTITVLKTESETIKSDASDTWMNGVVLIGIVFTLLMLTLIIKCIKAGHGDIAIVVDASIVLMILMFVISVGYGLISMISESI